MKRRINSLILITILSVAVIINSVHIAVADSTPVIKNVIYMIPDGGGFALHDFANAVKEQGGFNGGLYPNSTKLTNNSMYLKDYLIGTQTTHSATSSVTDSAAAGTALSSGYKTNNGYIGIDPKGRPHATILEAAQLAGKKTGIVSTYHWAHATPAAFTSHNESRENIQILSEQIVNQGLDVVLGVGFGNVTWGTISEATNRGYTITNNKMELASIEQGTKIWGNHHNTSIPYDINLASNQPTLAEMTSAAIRALDGSDDGFFLMVEGSKVDAAGHANNIVQAVSEYIAFDEAVKVALDYAKSRQDTIVIAAPDHDTGGLVLPNADSVGGNINSGDYAMAVTEVKAGTNSSNGISWATTGHTARKCGIWMYAPAGVSSPEGLSDTPGDTTVNRNLVIDNTQIPTYLASQMGLDLEAATSELFVDVTNMGSYNSNTKTFTFYDAGISIIENQSIANFDGRKIDLNGKIAVYSKKKFYVPKILIDMKENYEENGKIKVKTARYKDELTGKMIVKGKNDKAFAGMEVSLLLCNKGADIITRNDIGYVDQARLKNDGSYVFTFNFDGNVDDYEIKMYLGNKVVTDSITVATATYSWLDAAVLLVQEDNDWIYSRVVINNHYDIEGLTYAMYLAFYDENNKLISVSQNGNTKSIGDKITMDDLNALMPDGTVTVKAIIWSNYTQMIPLCADNSIKVH